ncbi:MAG: DUF4358 domain-containing protein [Lachnospiraceae bacterium]|nr:DUF4358 domain-containing protein [Lachnospiraceae bacterium]
MNKSIKILSLLLALLTLTFVFVSCSGGESGAKETEAPKDVVFDLSALGTALSKVKYEDEMAEITDDAVISAIYPEVSGAVKKVIYGGSGATPEEIILCEFESADAANSAKARFEKHLEDKKGIFDTYNAEYRPLLDKAVLEVIGKYVIYSVSADADAAKAAIEAAKK